MVNLGLPGSALSAANQETPQSSAQTMVKKLMPDDLALYIYEDGTSDVHGIALYGAATHRKSAYQAGMSAVRTGKSRLSI